MVHMAATSAVAPTLGRYLGGLPDDNVRLVCKADCTA